MRSGSWEKNFTRNPSKMWPGNARNARYYCDRLSLSISLIFIFFVSFTSSLKLVWPRKNWKYSLRFSQCSSCRAATHFNVNQSVNACIKQCLKWWLLNGHWLSQQCFWPAKSFVEWSPWPPIPRCKSTTFNNNKNNLPIK